MEPSFEHYASAAHGEAGTAWARRVPELVEEVSDRWRLTVGTPFAEGRYGYVVGVRDAAGGDAVLKLVFPGPEATAEIEALRLVEGRGAVRLLASDEARGALLMERALPGRPLRELCAEDDAAATRAAAGVMGRIRRPLPSRHAFPDLAAWLSGIERLRERTFGRDHPFGTPFVGRAFRLLPELLATAAEPVLLHGDLHHDNILSAGREPWLAIDPKGLAGEPAYECGALLRNPHPWLLEKADPAAVLATRLDVLSEELGLDRERLRAWGLVQAVLAAWWGYEEHGVVEEPFLACAALLDGLGK